MAVINCSILKCLSLVVSPQRLLLQISFLKFSSPLVNPPRHWSFVINFCHRGVTSRKTKSMLTCAELVALPQSKYTFLIFQSEFIWRILSINNEPSWSPRVQLNSEYLEIFHCNLLFTVLKMKFRSKSLVIKC